jgi:alkylation response protein AidB-like acyl-CoA dehydrogenase
LIQAEPQRAAGLIQQTAPHRSRDVQREQHFFGSDGARGHHRRRGQHDPHVASAALLPAGEPQERGLIGAAQRVVYVVFTRVNGVPGSKGIGCVLLEKTKGLKQTGKFHTIGGEHLAELQFDNVEAPLENLVLKEDSLRKLMSAFNTQRCLNPAICLGLAESSLEHSVRYLRDRSAFGHPIGDFQGMRWKVADMLIQIEAGRGLLYRAAATADPFPDPTLAAIAKVFVNEMSIKVCSEGVQVHGGYGFLEEFAVARNYTGVRYGTLGGGTTETLRNLIGRRLVDRMDLESGIAGLEFF